MTAKESLEQKLEKLGQEIGSDDALVENVMSRIDTKVTYEFNKAGKLKNKLIIRRFVMNRFTKLAAAAVIIAIGISIHYFTGSGTSPAYGITDVPELFSKARTLHLRGWRYFPGKKMPDGNDVPPVNWERWIDLENGREWSTTCSSSGRRDATKISVGELIKDSQYWMRLNHTNKWASFYKMSKYKQMLEKRRILGRTLQLILGNTDELDSFVKIGQEEIDGVLCDIWQREEIYSATKAGRRYRHWLSPSTGECKRIQFWGRFSDKQQWQLRHEYYKIERDVDIPEGIFAMEIPEGYEARNTKETATVLPLGSPMAACGFGVGFGTAISFTMSDGSVIWGWNSFDQKSEKPQEKFFEGLEFGGPLPKMPIEFNALKPAGEPKDITYTGYHLAYTRKGERFTEWAIYVPNGIPPKNAEQFGYHALYVFNLDRKPRSILNFAVPYGLLIETKEDFDKWVLAAMAELSDDGKAPESITYESVLQLAKQIRESLAR